ncbi:MAG: excinuclease ABC subunit UvrA, partial [Nanoarchaeota archaeon]
SGFLLLEVGLALVVQGRPRLNMTGAGADRTVHTLRDLVDRGNSVVVIEHNLDVIKSADWIIDLGPEGGDAGGRIIAEGTPETVAKNGKSYTGNFLKKII